MRLAGPERVRVWQVYLRAARRGFETGFTSIYQVLADRQALSTPAGAWPAIQPRSRSSATRA